MQKRLQSSTETLTKKTVDVNKLPTGGKIMKIRIKVIIDFINGYCDERQFFLACGLIKETLPLWENCKNYKNLCPIAKTMFDHYAQ